MASIAHNKLDIAIIGGGVAGCYCAYRLAEARPQDAVRLYEMSDRFGGRLWSKHLRGYPGLTLEMGGMFFSDAHDNTFALTERLRLARTLVIWTNKHQYLRGRLLTDHMYAQAAAIPYQLEPDERGKDPRELVIYALTRLVPDLPKLWPFTKSGRWGTPTHAAHYLRELRFGDQPIWACGFWNALSEAISNEALELLAATHGSAAAFRNTNAYDAIATLMWEANPGQTHYMLADGYQQLPLALKEHSEHAVTFVSQRRLVRVTTLRDGFRLYFRGPDCEETIEASSVILALPKRAIERIEVDEALVDAVFHDDIASVSGVPACRAYLLFERPWWNSANGHANPVRDGVIAAASTDQPMRQCYYFAKPLGEGRGLLMTAFADDAAAAFWTGLVSKSLIDRPTREWQGSDNELRASDALIRAAARQLQLMHPSDTIEAPIGAAFFDWSADPYGGGWHAWAPHVRSWEVRDRVRQPNRKLRFYVCGEAFAQPQGWVEGAINNAEVMLEKHFDVPRPTWVRDDYKFEI